MMIGAGSSLSESPVVETERLILRGHRSDDFDASFALWSTPAVVKYITRQPLTREESWARLLRHIGHWRLLGYGPWAVEERASGLYIGDVGFSTSKRVIEPSFDDVPEIGCALDPTLHGRSYATEAMGAAIAWADRHLAAPFTVGIASPDNQASVRLAHGCGYLEYGRTSYRGHEVIMFRRNKPPGV